MKSLFQGILPLLFLLGLSCNQEKPVVISRLYLPAAGDDNALWLEVSYIDGDLTRKEVHKTSSASDAYLNWRERISSDNGKTWSELKALDQVTQQLPEGGLVMYAGSYTYDPVLDILYQKRMRGLWPAGKIYDYGPGASYTYHSLVLENGREKELAYEPGPEFDPENPFDSAYCSTNWAEFGQRIVVDSQGVAYFPLVCASEEGVKINQGGIVLMRRDPVSGLWSASNRRFISPNVSSRGLLEPDVAVLKNGRLLIVCRGSNATGMDHVTYPDSLQARKWYLLSTDQGQTLLPVQELKYDDGSRFYSPSSIHTFVRSTKNGKLYWIANITSDVPDGNSPRYPLYVAEIDETIPAVKKNSLVLIDDRSNNESERLQLSNFSVLEDRETLDIEIYITKIGQNPDHFWQGAVYRYYVKLPNS